jgi:hypothetical protein
MKHQKTINQQKMLVLWAVPRSTSTAFEWMMRMGGDINCFHDPFGEAWYQGEQPLSPRVTADGPRTPSLALQSVLHRLQHHSEAGAVFSKNFPHYHYDDLTT